MARSVKATGAEFKAFYSDPQIWKDGAYHEEEELVVNGQDWSWDGQAEIDDIPDDAKVVLKYGVFYASGNLNEEDQDFTQVFSRWIRARKVRTFVLELPKGDERLAERVAAFAKELGGKVRS